jgi:hypothetical protein
MDLFVVQLCPNPVQDMMDTPQAKGIIPDMIIRQLTMPELAVTKNIIP